MTARANWGRHHRLVGLAVSAAFGLVLGAIVVGFIALFHPSGVQNVWEALGIMVAGGALSGLVQWWKSWPS